MRRTPLFVLLAALPMLFASSAVGTGNQTFRDAHNDVEFGVRDLRDIVVRNDNAGVITFDIRYDGSSEELDDDFTLWLDADRNRATGAQFAGMVGVDFMVSAGITTKSPASFQYHLWRDGRMHEYVVRGRRRADLVHLTVRPWRILIGLDRHLIGDTNGFRFRLEVRETSSLGANHADGAPDRGTWSFPVRISRRSLRPSLTTSRHARAGHRFYSELALRVARTKRLLGSGQIACHASVRGRRVNPTLTKFVDRRALCAWTVPPDSQGMTLRGWISVQVTPRLRVTRPFAMPIE